MKGCVSETNQECLDYIKSIKLKPVLFGAFVLAVVIAIMCIPMFLIPEGASGVTVIGTTIISAVIATCSMLYLLTLYDNCNKETPTFDAAFIKAHNDSVRSAYPGRKSKWHAPENGGGYQPDGHDGPLGEPPKDE